MPTTHMGAAVLSIDPFSEEGLENALEIDDAIRESGEVVYLEKYGTWFTGRHSVVEDVMRDYETFESGAGTGLTNTRLEENWRKPSVILENNPPSHTKYRRIMTSILSQRVVRRLRASFQADADALVSRVIGGELNAAKDLAEAYPLHVLPNALGFHEEGRRHLLPYSNLNFNAAGPRNERYRRAAEESREASEFVAWQMRREALDEEGLGQTIYGFVDEGEITEEDAGMLVRTFLSAGIDTTVFGIQFALRHLADQPGVWERLRGDPSLARQVFEETLRFTPSSPFIGRTTTREAAFGEAVIPAGQKVVVALAAANRDPRRWDRPNDFDLDRDTSGHLAFGTGVHGCVGQMMARMEATCLLTALAQQAESIELIGEPEIFYSNWLRGFENLPMRITRAA
ncbi:cytochrome P450 [Microbacterium halotolerans]|uniref:cytochrome P450 n=1 Tax=Microbacterium halotolerans TaxID=246613 RepID=UPI000E6AAAFF|nr:cytochrome P450 [Microbacterium halotolerans]